MKRRKSEGRWGDMWWPIYHETSNDVTSSVHLTILVILVVDHTLSC